MNLFFISDIVELTIIKPPLKLLISLGEQALISSVQPLLDWLDNLLVQVTFFVLRSKLVANGRVEYQREEDGGRESDDHKYAELVQLANEAGLEDAGSRHAGHCTVDDGATDLLECVVDPELASWVHAF